MKSCFLRRIIFIENAVSPQCCSSYLFYGLGAHQLNRKSNKELAAQMMAVQMMAAQMIVAATDRSNVGRDNNLLEKLPIHLMVI